MIEKCGLFTQECPRSMIDKILGDLYVVVAAEGRERAQAPSCTYSYIRSCNQTPPILEGHDKPDISSDCPSISFQLLSRRVLRPVTDLPKQTQQPLRRSLFESLHCR